jgi:Mrp family chromosome partitioning ATPase
VTDAAVLSSVADGAVLVIRTGKTTQEQLVQSLGNLEKVRGRILGAVLNYVPTSGTDAYSYYGTYTSASGPASAAEPHCTDPQRDGAEGDSGKEPVAAGRRVRG